MLCPALEFHRCSFLPLQGHDLLTAFPNGRLWPLVESVHETHHGVHCWARRDMQAALQSAVGSGSGVADGVLLDLGVSSMQVTSKITRCHPHSVFPSDTLVKHIVWQMPSISFAANKGTAGDILAVLCFQLDQAERGFSFMRDGPLDMRMGSGGAAMSAEALVNTADEAELGRILRDWGEERAWRRIAAR